MTTYTETTIRETARQTFKLAHCYACEGRDANYQRGAGWKRNGWRIQIDGQNTALVVEGACSRGHHVTAACAI